MAFDKAETIEFELNVMDVDLSKVKVDSFIYTYHDNKDVESGLGRAKFMALIRRSPTPALNASPSFGVWFRPVTFSAQDHSTSELLRTL